MWDLLLASDNKIFSIALALMLMIAVLELIALIIGHSMADALDSLLPSTEVHTEIAHPEQDAALSRFLSWLRVGQVPVLMLLVVWLLSFGFVGLTLQAVFQGMAGGYLPWWLSVPVAWCLSLPAVRFCGGILQKVMPKDETSAVSADSLIGRLAVVTLGEARQGFPAEAKVKDQFGYSHYIRLEPDHAELMFTQGNEVLLLSRQGTVYQGVINPNKHLSDQSAGT